MSFPIFIGALADLGRDKVRIIGSKAFAVLAVVVYATSLTDYAALVKFTWHSTAFVQLDGPRNQALIEARRMVGDGLVVLDTCIDPLIYKNATGGRVVAFNKGMAWPSDMNDILTISAAMTNGELAVSNMRAAGVQYVLADDHCDAAWRESTDPANLVTVGSTFYPEGSFTLYKLQ